MKSSTVHFLSARRIAVLGIAALLVAAGAAVTPIVKAAPQAGQLPTGVSEAEVLAAQQAWVDALVKISSDYESGGIDKAKQTAEAVIDSAYGYNLGPVLFKPTLASGPKTFRTTREGAVSYFVGGSDAYPEDQGFALKGWVSAEVRNAGILLNGNSATSMGHVTFYDKTGKATTVDKTWGYLRDNDGKLRIVVHHSSLPYGS